MIAKSSWKKMKNQIFYKIVPLKKYYCDSFLSALIIIQIQFTKALAIFTSELFQTDLCLTLVPFDLSVLVWGVFLCLFSWRLIWFNTSFD